MTPPFILRFAADGSARCLYGEPFPLQQLGRLGVRRASFVEFNPTTQSWEVSDTKRRVIFRSPSREACLSWEQLNLVN